MKVYVYPIKYVGTMPFGYFVPNFDTEPAEGELINYVSGVEKRYYETVTNHWCVDRYIPLKEFKSYDSDVDCAFVKIDGHVTKVKSEQIRFEKILNEYQILFRDHGVNAGSLEMAVEIANKNIEQYFKWQEIKKKLSEPIVFNLPPPIKYIY